MKDTEAPTIGNGAPSRAPRARASCPLRAERLGPAPIVGLHHPAFRPLRHMS
jgi:hypothetical protein